VIKRYIEVTFNDEGHPEPATWDENDIPVTYETLTAAQDAVTEHMLSIWEAVRERYMEYSEVDQPSIHECTVGEDGAITIKTRFGWSRQWTPEELKEMR
tara:strand:- start:4996 stop:5292 length:297 start_codon:yes stop_codon:yes gene_type:complete